VEEQAVEKNKKDTLYRDRLIIKKRRGKSVKKRTKRATKQSSVHGQEYLILASDTKNKQTRTN
jgi:hypothetical protein